MHTDRICYNGKMATPEQLGLRQELLTGVPAIYQLIHTTGKRQALHLVDHLELASKAYLHKQSHLQKLTFRYRIPTRLFPYLILRCYKSASNVC